MMRWNRPTLLGAAVCALMALPAGAQDFFDDFEGFPLGGGITGSDNYEEWCGSQGVDFTVVNTQAFSGTKSIMAEANDDVVYRVAGVTSGIWTVSVQLYVPSDTTGVGYFILLNQYPPADCTGGFQSAWWSSQIRFDAGFGEIEADLDPSNVVDLVFDAWREIRVVIDLDNDLYSSFYEDINGIFQPMVENEGWSNGNRAELAVIDLYSASSDGWFYDDLSIVGGGGGGEVAPLFDVTVIEGTLVSGGVPELASSDDTYFRTRAVETGEAAETQRLIYQARADTAVQNPSTIDITLEGHTLDGRGSAVTLFLRDFVGGGFVQVGQFPNEFMNDTSHTVNVPNASRFVRPSGRIVLRVKKVIVIPLSVGGFPSNDDLIEIRVQ